ncbi:Bug family tripartite tricarboxylate transporter substrate binding protein [Saliphagus sp. GCM10025334]
MQNNRSNVRRRQFLIATGCTATTVGIAGCLGGDDNNSDDDADGNANGSTDDNQDSNSSADWPAEDDTLRMVIPFSPGGGYDWYGRQIAEIMSSHLPNEPEIVAENVEGAGSLVGTNEVWNAEPDGHTLMIRHGLSTVHQQIGQPNDVEFQVSEFTNLAQVSVSTYGIVQRAGMDPVETWDDLVNLVTTGLWGSPGVGVTGHVFPLVLGNITGGWEIDDLDFVHYDGVGDAMAAMDRDEIDLYCPGIASNLPYIEDGVSEPVVTFVNDDEPGWDDTPSTTDLDAPDGQAAIDAFRAPRIICAPPDVPEDRAQVLEQALLETFDDQRYLDAIEEAERDYQPGGMDLATTATNQMFEIWESEADLLQELME